MPRSSCKKGQIWSLDFIAGLTLVSLLMMLFVVEWNYLALRWNTSATYRELLGSALFAADALFTTPGDPPGWERISNLTDVNVFGLANTRNALDNQKLDRLSSMNASASDYDLSLEKLGLAGNQMHITITDLSENITYFDYGRPSLLNNSAVVERFVLLNDSIVAKARLEVWH